MARPPHDPLEAPLAWAVLLPLFLLCTPLLVGVPTPVASGAGAVLLASLPAGLLASLRGVGANRVLTLLLVPLFATAALATISEPPFDSFSADRSLFLLLAGTILARAAASLGPMGRGILARGSLVATLALLTFACVHTWMDAERSYTGSLENTGHLAAAALPGALVAAAGWRRARGTTRVASLVALLGFGLYVALVPVHGAAVAFGLASLVALVASSGDDRRERRRSLALGLGLLGLLVVIARVLPDGSAPEATPSATSDAPIAATSDGETKGADFRLLTWQRLDELALDHPWLGVGPGQFEAAFPPYRDPAEIELSTFGRTTPFETQVEHPHNDWLLVGLELGLPIGLTWLAFLVLACAAALRCLREDEEGRVELGIAFLGLAFYAGVNGAFLGAPASSALGFALAGAVLGGGDGSVPRHRAARILPALLAALALTQSPRAWAFLQHGLALQPLSAEALVPMQTATGEQILGHEAGTRERILLEALGHASDSPTALAEWADHKRRTGAPSEEQVAAWSRLLSHQPRRFEALLAVGNLAARAGDREVAADGFSRARAVDARHPALLANEVQLALDAPVGADFGQVELREALDRFTDGRPPEKLSKEERDTLKGRAARQLLAGRPIPANLLLERAEPRLVTEIGEQAYAFSREFDGHDALLSDGFLALSHQLWGREHAGVEAFDAAIRSYRQSLRASRHHPPHEPQGALSVRLELAAALARDGRLEEAKAELQGTTPGIRPLRELPVWAGQALLEADLLGG